MVLCLYCLVKKSRSWLIEFSPDEFDSWITCEQDLKIDPGPINDSFICSSSIKWVRVDVQWLIA